MVENCIPKFVMLPDCSGVVEVIRATTVYLLQLTEYFDTDENLSIRVIVLRRQVYLFQRKSNTSSAYRLILWSVVSF